MDFEIQNMALNRPAIMGGPENFEAMMKGKTSGVESALGSYSVRDFSKLQTPGIYRVVLPETGDERPVRIQYTPLVQFTPNYAIG